MKVVPKTCGALHPEWGLRCGLYRPHRGPHRVLRGDYPYHRDLPLRQSDREWVLYRVRDSSGGAQVKISPEVNGESSLGPQQPPLDVLTGELIDGETP